MNFYFYGALIGILTILILYLRLATSITTREGIAAFLMALTNAFGLFGVMMFLGHGLVRIPRQLWHQRDAHLQLRKLEKRALVTREELADAEHMLSTLVREIHSLPHRTRHRPELLPYVDLIISKAPIPRDEDLLANGGRSNTSVAANSNLSTGTASNPSDVPRTYESTILQPISLNYLEEVNYRLPVALARRERAAWEWRTLLENAWAWQDIIENGMSGHARKWKSSIERDDGSAWGRTMRWWWKCRLRPVFCVTLSLTCLVLSFIVWWSEVTLAIAGTDLSLVRPLIGIGRSTEEVLILGMLLYVAGCTYSSFLKLRILSYFKLVPGQHTDELSLLFFAAYLTRLTFPLGYNYLMLVDRQLRTEFARVMGTMDLVPLLGRTLSYYVPATLTLICFLVIFRLHKRVTALLDTQADDRVSQGDLLDGAELVRQARREEEQHIARRRLYTSASIGAWRVGRDRGTAVNKAANLPFHEAGIRFSSDERQNINQSFSSSRSLSRSRKSGSGSASSSESLPAAMTAKLLPTADPWATHREDM